MTKTRYSTVAIVLHWLIAAAILYNLWMGEIVFDDNTPRAAVELHKSLGLTVLGLVILRILWRIGHRPPPLLPARGWEHKLATATHHTLYLLIVLVPLSGWLHDSAWKGAAGHPLRLFGTVPFFRLPLFGGLNDAGKDWWHDKLFTVHSLTAWLLIAALVLHIAGALKHQLVDRQPELQRMWFGRG